MTPRDGDDLTLQALPADVADVLACGGGYPDEPPLAVRARLRARLLSNAPPGPGISSDAGRPSAPPVTGRTGLAVLGKPIALALATYALGVASGLGLHARLGSSPPPATATPIAAPRASLAVAPAATAASAAPPRVTCSCPTVAPSVSGGNGAADRGLGRERALLDQARTALVDGDARAALAALDRHRRLFPEGRLEEERDVLSVQALLGAGRTTEARSAATRFLRKHPASLFRPAVEEAVEAPPATD